MSYSIVIYYLELIYTMNLSNFKLKNHFNYILIFQNLFNLNHLYKECHQHLNYYSNYLMVLKTLIKIIINFFENQLISLINCYFNFLMYY